jgi:hypothetical protein
LRCATESVVRSAQQRDQANLLALSASNSSGVFAVLREWKNEFRV